VLAPSAPSVMSPGIASARSPSFRARRVRDLLPQVLRILHLVQ
jgi:hypothetical protein